MQSIARFCGQCNCGVEAAKSGSPDSLALAH
ncbi:hypothetical protein EDD27_10538 [Nonomuraea polychroma]|uniref:Uncharacterized protein n=1 Tax=Nonomuraea polychroma TaxID=46176 RepID=A0A438MP76_9ACTN|nr:hypothetical protein EDD27_10538 [Nonomuraea polychroma]